jgi:hypothetical protein
VATDFRLIADTALSRSSTLIPAWLPGGKWQGDEWVARNPKRNDQHSGSFKVNRKTFAWADFATADRGRDAVSLYAWLHDLTQGDAARRLAVELGLTTVNGSKPKAVLPDKPVLTLAQFAEAKGLPVDFLSAQGVHEDRNALVFRYMTMDGQRAARQRIRVALDKSADAKKFLWSNGAGQPTLYGLWHLHQWVKDGHRSLLMLEGESDALTAWYHDLPALGVPGADMTGKIAAPHIRGFDRIYVVKEADDGGATFVAGMTGQLGKLGFRGQAFQIDMSAMDVKDLSALHLRCMKEPGSFEVCWNALVADAQPITLPVLGLKVDWAVSIEPKQVAWHWDRRIPRGKLVLLIGPPGVGKSWLSLYVASRLSTGQTWIDGAPIREIVRTIIFSAEDGKADTIRPRLESLGSDLDKVGIVGMVNDVTPAGEKFQRPFTLPRDIVEIEKFLDAYPDIGLIIVDPISAYMGKTDSYNNSEVRGEILAPLAEIAERRNVTILCISHLNKNANSNALERIAGSIAFGGAARIVWGCLADPDDPSRNLLLYVKGNLGPRVDGLAYRIAEDERHIANLYWLGGNISESMDSLLQRQQEQQRDSGGRKLEQAKDLLREMLRDGERPVTEIEDRARQIGISDTTLKRAKQDLAVSHRRDGFGPGSRIMAKLPIAH